MSEVEFGHTVGWAIISQWDGVEEPCRVSNVFIGDAFVYTFTFSDDSSQIVDHDSVWRNSDLSWTSCDRCYELAAPKIVSVKLVEDDGCSSFNGATMVVIQAEFNDGSSGSVGSYYTDERSFSASEFVGLTVSQAHKKLGF